MVKLCCLFVLTGDEHVQLNRYNRNRSHRHYLTRYRSLVILLSGIAMPV